MAVEAPLSRSKKGNLRMYIIVCVIVGIWFAYDGYKNQKFISEHTTATGPDSTLAFNQKSSPFFLGAAVVLGFFYWAAKDRKLVADETELKIGGADSIPYDKMEAIDRTNFAAKGYFILTYKDFKDRVTTKKFSDRQWDNLGALLDVLAAKLSA